MILVLFGQKLMWKMSKNCQSRRFVKTHISSTVSNLKTKVTTQWENNCLIMTCTIACTCVCPSHTCIQLLAQKPNSQRLQINLTAKLLSQTSRNHAQRNFSVKYQSSQSISSIKPIAKASSGSKISVTGVGTNPESGAKLLFGEISPKLHPVPHQLTLTFDSNAEVNIRIMVTQTN